MASSKDSRYYRGMSHCIFICYICQNVYFSQLSSLFQRFALDVRKLTQPSQLRTQHLMANVKDTHPIRGFMRKPNYKPATTTSSVAVPSERVASTDTIMTVSISPPAMPLAPSQTLRILGTQTLLDLRDAIYCLYDHVSYSKCCLVIDDTVFVDTRAADIVEYKALINRWKSRESNTRISTANASPLPSNALLRSLLSVSPEDTSDVSASFHVVQMHSTMINSLTITLGKCYTLLHHHLSCAHHVYFTDITLYNSKYDSKYRSSYPLLVHQAKLHRRKCGVCGVLAADFCTFGDRLVDKSPYFFCHGCYQMLHYDCEGNLLYKDFAVFPYYHDTK